MEHYEITVEGAVGPLVVEAMEGFEVVEISHGRSRVAGSVVDQAAFHGMLNTLQDLRLEIVEIHRVDHP
ncbi:MAG: hypothetical protein WCA30_09920 [Dermatophilaceae bacterium]